MATSLTFEFQFEAPERAQAAAADRPMRILVMGDFSGRANGAAQGGAGVGLRLPHRIDIDNIDRVIAQLAPSLQLTIDGAPTTLEFGQLDDFHPDQLYQQADAFHALRGQRQRLKDPATFAKAAAQLRPGADAPAASAAEANPFASLLGGEIRRAPAAPTGTSDIDALVKSLIGAMPVGADPRQAEFVAVADAVTGATMRAVLHDPAFQSLEAAWRGLHLLAAGLELDENLQLHILDLGKAELQAGLDAAGDEPQGSALYQLLVDAPRHAPDGSPWSIIVGDYRFDDSEHDVGLLAAIGVIAAQAGAPFLSAASERLLGCAALASEPDPAAWRAPDAASSARWQALRESPQARWIGLALPRLLLRLPYGKATDRIDQFVFEEFAGAPVHADYLWGNAAFGCALLLGRAFLQRGWQMAPGDELDLEDLPAHTWRRDGESRMQACAETCLSERAAETMLQRGLMPLLSFRNRNALRLLRSQSIAHPARALSGPWDN